MEFGSGFKIAMRDLEIRGAGNLLGPEQSGYMMSVGYDMYLKLLKFAEDNGFKKEEYFFEDTLLDDMSRFSYDDYVLRISLPLKKD